MFHRKQAQSQGERADIKGDKLPSRRTNGKFGGPCLRKAVSGSQVGTRFGNRVYHVSLRNDLNCDLRERRGKGSIGTNNLISETEFIGQDVELNLVLTNFNGFNPPPWARRYRVDTTE